MGNKRTKSNQKIQQKWNPITELVNHLPSLRMPTLQNNTIILKRMVNSSICLLSIYGKSVEDYINQALVFPANNPKAFADRITRDVIGQIFPPHYKPEFNQYVSISTALVLEKLDELSQITKNVPDAIQKIKENQEDFITHEIDAIIYVSSAEMREKWMEIKLFTCPHQTAKVLNRLLQPAALQSYFLTNDYLGLMGFSLVCTKEGEPVPYQKTKPLELEEQGNWMIHLILLDAGVLSDPRTTGELGSWILSQIELDLTEMSSHLGLYKQNLFFKMTENFVKVVRMTQIIEEYKEELRLERKAREEERKAREKAEKKIKELEHKLAKYEQSK